MIVKKMAKILANHTRDVLNNKCFRFNANKCITKFFVELVIFMIWVAQAALTKALTWIAASKQLCMRIRFYKPDIFY
ncbi:hypothetical protein BI380_03875 [Delftia tsuruhatensis]|uniref:Transposase n=1 Tax=Delftia tsuruhatensis TaxID=180282 RepID=A0ABN4SEI3_9BURK|nr:hypothetical protein BI380_03875 [Delftia tsuruhatensis]